MRKIVQLLPDGSFRLEPLLISAITRIADLLSMDDGTPEFSDLFSPALEDLARAAAQADRSARRSASRHRPLGPGDV